MITVNVGRAGSLTVSGVSVKFKVWLPSLSAVNSNMASVPKISTLVGVRIRPVSTYPPNVLSRQVTGLIEYTDISEASILKSLTSVFVAILTKSIVSKVIGLSAIVVERSVWYS